MTRRYKTVERMLHLWIFKREHEGDDQFFESAFASDIEDIKLHQPSIPLHSPDLYFDSALIKAS